MISFASRIRPFALPCLLMAVLLLNAADAGAEDAKSVCDAGLKERKEDAEAFLQFKYQEVKDLAKQFLTVVSAFLAFSVAFSEKVIGFDKAHGRIRALMMGSWVLCLTAIVLGGVAIFYAYTAGMDAKNVFLHPEKMKCVVSGAGKLPSYAKTMSCSHFAMTMAGCSFALGLLLTVVVGIAKLYAPKAPVLEGPR